MLQNIAYCRRIRFTQVHIVRYCRNHYVVRVNGKQQQKLLLCRRVRQQKQKTAECVCVGYDGNCGIDIECDRIRGEKLMNAMVMVPMGCVVGAATSDCSARFVCGNSGGDS